MSQPGEINESWFIHKRRCTSVSKSTVDDTCQHLAGNRRHAGIQLTALSAGRLAEEGSVNDKCTLHDGKVARE